ncbi:drug/metabolite transporter, DME family [Amycolatopsis arida]|uniref:Drug/metabolite transporter, DME family n=1 Tax=Amycolatopsis arida TaxID=587909 RepID=A0A1I5XRN0_9PSEU|nr:DMT family transporter [Amycolatopsis arida]TDX97301.1 DME family drug/metabolite transporter [Amycolatopsis arida]SFQ34599.1 drug/metabolite transporter, DME family [Amycolatopsis arida]
MSTSLAVRSRTGSAAALVTAGVLWGTGGLAGALLATHGDLHPLSVATYRLLLGGVLAVLFLAATGGLRGLVTTSPVVRRVLTAGGLLAMFQACYFAAVALTSVSLATMTTIGSVPVFVALATTVRERRRPATPTLVSILAALVGLVLLTGSPDGGDDRGTLAAGLLCALAAGAGFATLTMATRRPVPGLDPLRTTAFGLLTGGVLLLPLALWLGMALPLRAEALALAVYLGAVPTALAYAAYFRGLRDASPVLAALSALLEPLTAAVLAAALLGDRLGVGGWCGAALLAGALALTYRRGSAER